MKSNLLTADSLGNFSATTPRNNRIPFLSRPASSSSNLSFSLSRQSSRSSLIVPICCSRPIEESKPIAEISSSSNLEVGEGIGGEEPERNLTVQVGNPVVPSYFQSWTKLSLSDQAFLLLTFIACTTSIAFTSFVVAAIPTLYSMGRAATSLSKLADAAREELPSTMAAIRLSGMEISDLTLELSDLSQEIADGVNKSAQAVQAAEAGIRRIGSVAHQHTISMIEERANLPTISLQPVVAGAAKKTSHAVGQATKSFLNLISRGGFCPENELDDGIDRVEM